MRLQRHATRAANACCGNRHVRASHRELVSQPLEVGVAMRSVWEEAEEKQEEAMGRRRTRDRAGRGMCETRRIIDDGFTRKGYGRMSALFESLVCKVHVRGKEFLVE